MKHVIVIETVDPSEGGFPVCKSLESFLIGFIEGRMDEALGVCVVRSMFNAQSAIAAVHEMYGAPKWNPEESL